MKIFNLNKEAIFSCFMGYAFLPLAVFVFLAVTACQQSSDNGDISSSNGNGSSGSTAPSTTISSNDCETINTSTRTISCATTSPTIRLSSSGATIYYEKGTSSSIVVSETNSQLNSVDITFTGDVGTPQYLAFYAKNSDGTEASKTYTIYFTSAPSATLTYSNQPTSNFVDNYCTYDISGDNGRKYTCVGNLSITISTGNTDSSTTIFYDKNVGSVNFTATNTSNNSTSDTITEDNTYIRFYAQTSSGNAGSEHIYHFTINGVIAVDGNDTTKQFESGYYNSSKSFQFRFAEKERGITNNYQIWYNKSDDASNDSLSVFNNAAPKSDALKYYSTFLNDTPSSYSTLDADHSSGMTKVYQFARNVIRNTDGDLTTDANNKVYAENGITDGEASLALYIDGDHPTLTLLPPTSGSLNSNISVSTFVFDKGHQKVEEYRYYNSDLPGYRSTTANTHLPLKDATQDSNIYPHAWYCIPDSLNLSTPSFWDGCNEQSGRRTDVASGKSIPISSDSYVIMNATDMAGNKVECYDPLETDKPYNCWYNNSYDPTFSNIYIFKYTPGMLESSLHTQEKYDEEEPETRNIGYSIAAGNIDGTGDSDIVVGAPAYSSTDSTYDAYGSLYLWYNGFRERASLTFTLNDSSIDVSNKWMEFSTDGNESLRVYLDPSDSSADNYSQNKYKAKPSPDNGEKPYSNIQKATATEIAEVLNKAFQSSQQSTYQNHLYAVGTDATTCTLEIGHLNKSLEGFFTYSSNFTDPSSDFYYSGNPIKAYDYKIYGEESGSEFGFSVAIGHFDTSPESGFAENAIVVGAPKWGANDEGAVYIIRVPNPDSTADQYGELYLSDPNASSNFHAFYAPSEGRLGYDIEIVDLANDAEPSMLFVSAPYFDGNGTDRGSVYRIPGQTFLLDTTSDISADSNNDRMFWNGSNGNGTNTDGSSADYNFFGFSLESGVARFPSDIDLKEKTLLFIGAPGNQDVKGRVRYFSIEDHSLNSLIGHNTHKPSTSSTGDLYGYSLAVVHSEFDSDFEVVQSKCDCLAVGSPGYSSNTGRVWLLGDNFSGYFDGDGSIASGDKLGLNVYSGMIGVNGTSSNKMIQPLLIATGNYYSNMGQIKILKPRLLSGTGGLLDTTNAITIRGEKPGQNFGKTMSIADINESNDIGLVLGMPGSKQTYMGTIRVYSPEKIFGD